jgi:hypothetical protein
LHAVHLRFDVGVILCRTNQDVNTDAAQADGAGKANFMDDDSEAD